MKILSLLLFFVFGMTACNLKKAQDDRDAMAVEIAKIKDQVTELKPGLGEIMGVIQQHHAKLYYSGIAENWELAGYQVDEIKEGLDQVAEQHEHFKGVKPSLRELRHVMDGGIQSVETAIQEQDKTRFIKAFQKMTVSCNQCHQAANHPFIVVQVPTANMFPNQKFTKEK